MHTAIILNHFGDSPASICIIQLTRILIAKSAIQQKLQHKRMKNGNVFACFCFFFFVFSADTTLPKFWERKRAVCGTVIAGGITTYRTAFRSFLQHPAQFAT